MERTKIVDTNAPFDGLKAGALSTLEKLHSFIEQDDILVVPTSVCSDGFSSRSTV